MDDSASHLEDQLSQGRLAEADNMEEPGQDSEASSQNRLVPLSCLNAASFMPQCCQSVCILR